MKWALIIILLLGGAILGARQISYFADPAIECADLKKRINASKERVETLAKELINKSGESANANEFVNNLKREQFKLQYLEQLRLLARLNDVHESPDGRRKSECDPKKGVTAVFYSEAQLKSLGVELPMQ